MENTATRISRQVSVIQELTQAADRAIETLLTLANEADPTDRDAAPVLLDGAKLIGENSQAREGQLVRLLAQAHRVKANRGGLAPWISRNLDVTDGRARGLAQSAREIGHLPELAEPLSSGQVGAGTIRALTRTATAVKHTGRDLADAVTTTLETATRDGVGEANRQVRVLEESIHPGRAESTLTAQRRRSFLRMLDRDDGMCRIEGLLDNQRATVLKAAMDTTVAAYLRAREHGAAEPVSDDVQTVEQLQAQALTRFAEVFLTTDPGAREAPSAAPALCHASLDPRQDAGMAETIYGMLVPRSILTPPTDPASPLLHHVGRHPILLDHRPVDRNPATRLATAAQRSALAWRDRHCTYPGCHRPPVLAEPDPRAIP